jgi:phage repressor protein C with HTH and peptisase S24 domain
MRIMANRIKEWRLKRGLSMQALAERVGTSRQQIHKLERSERRLTEDWMRRVAGILDCAPADLLSPEMDRTAGFGDRRPDAFSGGVDMSSLQSVTVDGRDQIPVYASAQGGPDGTILAYEPIEFVDRPEPLFGVRNAFAMYVVSDSMEPKYSQGALLLIHPGRPVRQNDFVLIVKQAEDGEHSAMVKQLVRVEADRLIVRQFNPPHEFALDRRDVTSVSLVIGSFEAR